MTNIQVDYMVFYLNDVALNSPDVERCFKNKV